MEKGQKRILASIGVALAIWVGLVARLFFVQVVCHDFYSRAARIQQTKRVEIPGPRGRILDRNSRPLAENVRTASVTADPAKITDKQNTARILSEILPVSERELFRQISRKENFVWLARQCPPLVEKRLSEKKLEYVSCIDEMKRVYPAGDVGRAVIGLTDVDGRGIEGIEGEMDGYLKGTPGWVTLFNDVKGKRFPLPKSYERPPASGYDIMLTIDAGYQEMVESKLIEGIARHNAKSGTVILLAPRTGEILAMAGASSVGDQGGSDARQSLKNIPVSDLFEPGSTFKIVAASAALSTGVCDSSAKFSGEDGQKDFGGFVIHDTHPHGLLSFRNAIALSSNVCLAKIGLKVGKDAMYRYAKAFGFGSSTGLQLPGETPGRVRPPSEWSGRSLCTISIGQEISVTALQLAMAYGAIANGGILMKPTIVKSISDEKGNIIKRYRPQRVRRVISEDVARTMRDFLTSVVEYGTGVEARLDWVSCAGKTGTAEKYDAASHGYGGGQYVSSFVGFIPADQPELLCLVIIDEPRGSYYGGSVAAPIFKEIVEVIGRFPLTPVRPEYAHVELDKEEQKKGREIVPDVRYMEWQEGKAVLEELGFRVRVTGTGRRIWIESPQPGQVLERKSEITLTLLDESAKSSKVPDVRGLSLREAARVMSQSLLAIETRGSGVVTNQNPMPGTEVPPGTVCQIGGSQ